MERLLDTPLIEFMWGPYKRTAKAADLYPDTVLRVCVRHGLSPQTLIFKPIPLPHALLAKHWFRVLQSAANAICPMDISDGQPFFLDDLPLEISFQIASYFQQNDFLTCMSVCRSWYSSIPQHARHLWRYINIDPEDNFINNKRMQLCVGEHVEIAEFDTFANERELFKIMEKLIDCGCTRVEIIKFRQCNTRSQEELGLLLKQLFSPSAKKLTFKYHVSDLDLLHVLSTCPTITKFIFEIVTEDFYIPDMVAPTTYQPEFELDNLSWISIMTTGVDIIDNLIPVLQKCPNLRYLRYTEPDEPFSIDTDQLFSWCPRLEHLEINPLTEPEIPDLRVRSNWAKDDHPPGLRYLVARQMDLDKVLPYITRNAGSLDYIIFGSFYGNSGPPNRTRLLQNMRCPELRSLEIHDGIYQESALHAMLKNCPALEYLNLYNESPTTFHLLDVLRSLTHLKCLYVGGITIRLGDIPSSVSSLSEIVNQLALSNSKVQEISLKHSDGLSDSLLLTLSALRSLKRLDIDSKYATPQYSEDVFCHFIESLGQTQITTITLSGIGSFPPRGLRALGGFHSLERLELFSSPSSIQMDAASLAYFLQNCTSLRSFSAKYLKLTGTDDEVPTFLQREAPDYQLDASGGTNSDSFYIDLDRYKM